MAATIPQPTLPIFFPQTGLIDTDWYTFLKGVSSGSVFPAGASADLVLGTDGSTVSWVGFLQAGTGAILRTFRDKMRDLISVKDWGTNTAAFDAAFAASNGVKVPAGSYSATATVGYDQIMEMDSGASISTVNNAGTVIRKNYNPDNLTWTSWAGKSNKAGIQVDMGYGNTTFGNPSFVSNIGQPISIIGSIKIPATATNAAAGVGVAGYSATLSTTTLALGVYGQGEINVTAGLAWGGNFLVSDNGFDGNQLWILELDANIYNAGTNILGCDITGGSTVEVSGSNISIAHSIQPLGVFASPPKRWDWGIKISDGSCITGVEIGAASTTGTSISSQQLQFASFNSGGGRITAGRIGAGSNGTLNLDGDNGVSIRSNGNNPYIQVSSSGTLGFYGAGRFVGLQTISGSTSTQTGLVLKEICVALHQMGLITDTTT